MTDKCPQDGGFIGDAGCTHHNHQHSAIVKRLLYDGEPKMMTAEDARDALLEGFYVDRGEKRVGFGHKLLEHISTGHNEPDTEGRLVRLHFAVDTVKNPDKVEENHKGFPGRTAYFKAYESFGIIAVSEQGSENLDYVFTVVPRRSGKKGLPPAGQSPANGTAAK